MAAKKSAQNVRKTAKPRGKPFQPGADERRGSSGGRPKNEQSISYWLTEFGQMTPEALAGLCETYAKDLRRVKGDIPMFAHIAIRALMGQINEPSPGVLALVLDRTEGKVKDMLELSGKDGSALRIEVVYADNNPDPAKAAPGTDAGEA